MTVPRHFPSFRLLARELFRGLWPWLFGAYILVSLPLVVAFAANQYFSIEFFNISSHYRAKLARQRSVHVGDSITAGGHWSLLLSSLPFDSINLSGNGYTIRQIQDQVHKALAYNPEAVVIMAGTK